ncbi:MAG: efflux RND transporter permease subunit [Flavobacteriales bacterium]|jgi:CzcA family heavy metal efflux pump|nr:efflux RND transporter permease subunit [Flavobacteriales bacterium]
MLRRILLFSLQNRAVVLLVSLFLTLGGSWIAKNMNVDVFPDLTAPSVTILTEAHGLEAEEVEKLVSFPLETAMMGSPNVRRIRSSSANGISIVWVEFDWGTDIYKARQIVSERIPLVEENLPEDIGTPTMGPISSIMGEVMTVGVSSDSINPKELRTIADWVIRPRIKSIPGIANVIVLGGELKQYQVLVDPAKLMHYKIGISEVLQKVKESSKNAPGGILNEFGNEYIIKGTGRIYDIQELEESLVKMIGNQPVKIKDIAQVKIGHSDKIGDGSVNGNPAVILTISKQPDVNTLALTKELDQVIDDLKRNLPEGIELNNQIFRQANFIQTSIDNLKNTLLEGAFFVVIILLVFLMNWRTTIISLLAIPLSLLVSLLVLNLLGYTLNTMSLGGMAIAIGALVDDAIIDVENVFKRLRENYLKPKEEKLPVLKIIEEASLEIRSSIIIATLIIIVSFIPLFFLSGMEGRLLQPLGIAFVTSILTSLIVAVTVTPVLSFYLLKSDRALKNQAKGTFVERWLQKVYQKTLQFVLKVPKLILLFSVLAFALSMGVFQKLGRSFLPEFNEGSIVISVVGIPGTNLEESNKIGGVMEDLLRAKPEVKQISRRTGRAELDEHAQGVHAAEIDVLFELSDGKTKDEFFEEVRETLSIIPGVNITLGQPIGHRIDHMLSGTRANIAIKIFGEDLSELFTIGKKVESAIGDIVGIADLAVDQQIEVPQLKIVPNRQMLSAYGLTMTDFLTQMDIALAGEKAGNIFEGQKYHDLIVRLDKKSRDEQSEFESVPIFLPDGNYINLGQIAEIKSISSPVSVSRENIQRKIVVSANVQNRDLKSVVEEIRTTIQSEIELPKNYRIEYGGQFESEAKASQMLTLTAILAVLIILFLLYYEFQNIKLALIVLLNLPLSLIGGILIIYFNSGIVDIAATIGFISLFGIATRNGILLVSKYEELKKSGMRNKELIIKGALDRLNPILMTTFTTGLALIPLALKAGEAGNEIQSPMAIVILGGLMSSTILNLLVVPVVYSIWKPKVV